MRKIAAFLLIFALVLSLSFPAGAALSPEYATDAVLLTQTYRDPDFVFYDVDIRHLSAHLSECIIEIGYNGAVLKADTVTPANGTEAAIASCGAGVISLHADTARLTEEINRLAEIQFAIVGSGSFDISVKVLSCKTSGGKDHTLFPCLWAQKMFRSLSEKEREAYLKLVPLCSAEGGYIYALPEETDEEFLKRISAAAGENFVMRTLGDFPENKGYSCILTRDNAKAFMLPGAECGLNFGINQMLTLTVITVGDIAGNDGKITAADARAALRMSVGLEIPTPEQRFAYMPLSAAERESGWKLVPTAALARTLLRITVGLEQADAYLEKCYDE